MASPSNSLSKEHRNILINKRIPLIKTTVLNARIWQQLADLGVVDQEVIEENNLGNNSSDDVIWLFSHLLTRTDFEYHQVCEVLSKEGQQNAVNILRDKEEEPRLKKSHGFMESQDRMYIQDMYGEDPINPSKTEMKKIQRTIALAIMRFYSSVEVSRGHDVGINDIYIEPFCKKSQKTVTGSNETQLNTYVDIIEQVSGVHIPLHVVVTGPAGTGKSTLCKRILVDWATFILSDWWRRTTKIQNSLKRNLGRFSFIFPIFLSKVKKGEIIHEAICQQLNLETNMIKYLIYILRNEGEKVLFLLDGYDEYQESHSTSITKLAHKEVLGNVNVILTSRNPPEFESQFNVASITHIKLKGFNDAGVRSYITKVFEKTEDADDLIDKINSPGKNVLLDLSKYPVHLIALCNLQKSDRATLLNNHLLVERIILNILCLFEGKSELYPVPPDSETLLAKYRQKMMIIGKLLFREKANLYKIIFQLEQFIAIKSVSAIGFFEICIESGKLYLDFPHDIFVDYFRAHFLMECEPAERDNVIKNLIKIPGIVKNMKWLKQFIMEKNQGLLIGILEKLEANNKWDTDKVETYLVVDTLIHTQNCRINLPCFIRLELIETITNELLIQFFSQNANGVLDIILWSREVKYIASVMKINAINLKKITLEYIKTGFVKSWELPRDPAKNFPHLESIAFIGFSTLDNNDYNEIFRLIQSDIMIKVGGHAFDIQLFITSSFEKSRLPKLKYIEFSTCDGLMEVLCSRIRHTTHLKLSKWEQFDNREATHDGKTDGHRSLHTRPGTLEYADSFLPYATELETFIMHDSEQGIEVRNLVANGIRNLVTLKNVSIYSDGVPSHLNDVIEALPNNIEELDLSNVNVSPPILKAVSGKTKALTNIKRVSFPKSKSVTDMNDALKSIPHVLTVLDMRGNKVDESGHRVLGMVLPGLLHLTELRPSACFELNALYDVIMVLHHTKELQVLDLTRNIIDLNLLQILTEKLQHLIKLQEFRACRCESPGSMEILTKHFPFTVSLKIFDISGNNMKPDIDEILETLGTCSGNRGNTDVYSSLKKGLEQKSVNLEELRLCECNEPNAFSSLISVVASMKHVQVLDLRGNIGDSRLSQKFGAVLRELRHLRTLRLFKIDNEEAMFHIVRNLKQNINLEILDISGIKEKLSKRWPIDEITARGNSMKGDVYTLLGEMISSLPKLQELRVCHCEQINAMKPLVDNLKMVPKLKILDVTGSETNQDINQELALKLTNMCELIELRLHHCMDPKGLVCIIKQFNHMQQLRILDITGRRSEPISSRERTHNIADENVYEALEENIACLKKLEELRLCPGDPKWCMYFTDVIYKLKNLKKLKVLQIGENSLNLKGIQALGNILPELSELRQLILIGCYIQSHERQIKNRTEENFNFWLNFITSLTSLKFLKVLVLSSNAIGDDSCRQLARQIGYLRELDSLILFGCALRDEAALMELVEALPTCPSLRLLSVRNNFFGDGLTNITKKTKKLSNLAKFILGKNKLSEDAVRKIAQACKTDIPETEVIVEEI